MELRMHAGQESSLLQPLLGSFQFSYLCPFDCFLVAVILIAFLHVCMFNIFFTVLSF